MKEYILLFLEDNNQHTISTNSIETEKQSQLLVQELMLVL